MTDNEIVKALECCCDYDNNFNEMRFCQVCPLYSNRGECNELLHEYTRDLINRQNAEIEALRKEKNKLMDAQMFLAKTSNEQQAEIERLKEKMVKHNFKYADTLFSANVATAPMVDNLLKETESENDA